MRRFGSRVAIYALVGVAVFAAAIAASTVVTRSADDEKGILAGLISRALTTPASRVSVGAVDGALSSDATVRNITIADNDGVWLELDRARLVWRRTALLFGRLEIDRLEIGTLKIARRPVRLEDTSGVSDEPILPELPVKVVIKAFELQTLDLGTAVVGTAARLSASGNVTLGKPSEGLNLKLDVNRIDAAGALTAALALVPETSKLDLALKLDEPANGILAHAINLPGQAPVTLDVNGSGTLDDFSARLDFTAGSDIGANGSAQLHRRDEGRHLALDLAANIGGMLPDIAAPVFAGTTRLIGDLNFAPTTAVNIAGLSVVSQTARLDIRGDLSPEQVADLTISARAVPNNGAQTSVGGADIKKLVFDATIKGDLAGPQVDAKLALEDARTADLKLAALDATFNVTPSGNVSDDETSIPFRGAVTASGIQFNDATMGRAVGSTLSVTLNGTSQAGIADIAEAQIRTETASARYAGKAGPSLLKGRLLLQAPDLARFGRLGAMDLRGQLELAADLEGVPDKGSIYATLDGKVSGFATGNAAIDGLSDGQLALTGAAGRLPKAGYMFRNLKLAGAHAMASLDGVATAEKADIGLRAAIDDLGRADKRLSGKANATAKMSGTLNRPDLSATFGINSGKALGRSLQDVALGIEAKDIFDRVDSVVSLDGLIDGKPARGRMQIAKRADDGWSIDDVDVRVGTASATGEAVLDAAQLASGRLSIDAPRLDDLSPLLLTKLSGQLTGDLTFSVADGGQDGTLNARGSGLKAGDASIDTFDANATVTDLYRRPVVDGAVSVDRAVIGGQDFTQVRLSAKGATDASDIALTAQARGLALDMHGKLVPAQPVRFDIGALSARRDRHRVALLKPTSLAFADGGIAVRDLAMSLDSGRLNIDGTFGAALDVALRAQAIPLSVADLAMPELGFAGTLDGSVKFSGTTGQPNGDWSVRVAGFSAPQTREFGLPPATISASGHLADGRSSIKASLEAKGAGSLNVTGFVPLAGDALDVTARGQLNAVAANAVLGAGGRRVGGQVKVDVRAQGTLAQPAVNGSATISGGSFTDSDVGIKLTGIEGQLSARGQRITIARLTAQTPNGGALSGRGSINLDPDAGFPGELRVTGQRATLADNDVVDAVANLDVSLSGPPARDPRISGRVDIVSLEVTIPERLPTTTQPIDGTRHVNAPRNVAARLAARSKAGKARARQAPFDVALDLAISAPNRIFVRGRGVDAELGGALRLSGRLNAPTTLGAFELRRGRFAIAGNLLDFTRGRLTFTGGMSPELDFVADTRASDVTAHILISGNAAEPEFTFSSDPNLPQDEVLSRILFAKASGGLSAIQALQLAQTAAQFSGAGGPDVFDRLRRSLGVNSLNISEGQGGGPAVGISRAINNRVSVGVKGGARPEDSGVSLDFDLTRRLRLQGEVNSKGGAAAGVGAEWEY